MTVHTFGATYSQSCCNFALKRTVVDFGKQFDSKVADPQAISPIEDVTALC